jgi:molybdopterin-guanine dinucleotide biosynthesis protein A
VDGSHLAGEPPRSAHRVTLPSMASHPLAGVVLCGGGSRRMGVDKVSITVDGSTLLERAILRLGEVCDPVLIAPGEHEISMAGHPTVLDARSGAGPLAAIIGGLRHSPHRLLAVVAVDLPWLDPHLIRLLADRIAEHDVAVCETDRGVQPLHAVYARSALPAAEAALESPDRSVRSLIDRLHALRVTESEWRAAGVPARFADNVNTPADLAALNPQASRRTMRRWPPHGRVPRAR